MAEISRVPKRPPYPDKELLIAARFAHQAFNQ